MKCRALVLAVTFALACGASAQAAEAWRVTEASGAVTASAPLAASHNVVRGEVFAPGTVITTGHDGRLVFGDGKTVITMAASSRLTTPSDSSDVMTRFTEDMGSVFFRVEKRPMQHFEVQGPLLAAVVKGTQFTVSIDGDKNSIAVSEGLVEAVAMQGGAKELVPAGRAAAVDRAQPLKLKLTQTNASGAGSIKQAIGAEPINYAQVTAGLVRAEPVSLLFSTASPSATETTLAASEDGANNGNSGGNGGGGGGGGGNDGATGGNGGGDTGTGNGGDTGNGGGNGNGNSGNGNGGGDGSNGGGDGSNSVGDGSNGGGNGNGNGNGNSGNGNGNGGGDGSNGGGNGNGNNGNGNGNGGGDGSNGGGNGNGNNGNGNGNGGGNGSNGGGNGNCGNGNGNGGGLPGGGDAPGNGGNGNGNGNGHGKSHGKGG